MRTARLLVPLVPAAVAAAVGLTAAGVAAAAPAAGTGGAPLGAGLTGAQEVPGPGDPDGSGTATLRVNPGRGLLCYELSVQGIDPATAAHVHVGTAGVAGPVVVPLSPPSVGTSSGCTDVDRALLLDILRDPQEYYVNVHNATFPAGAVRGQLGR